MKKTVLTIFLLFSCMVFAETASEEKAGIAVSKKAPVFIDSESETKPQETETTNTETPEIPVKKKKEVLYLAKEGDPQPEPVEKEEKKPGEFVKGELANVGSYEIIYPYNSFGLRIGLVDIDEIYYISIDPNFSLYMKNFTMGLHLPFNVEAFNTADYQGNSTRFTLRSEDWDDADDYLRIIKYITYGRSEDTFYASIGSNNARTLGHGTIMKRFMPNLDPNTARVSGKLNYYNEYFGFETVIGDISLTSAPNIFGGLIFIKPLSFFKNDYRSQSLSFGYSMVVDISAPTSLNYVKYIDRPDIAPYPDGMGDPRIASDPDDVNRPYVNSSEAIAVQGVDVEFKVYRDFHTDIKIYGDYSWISTPIPFTGKSGYGGGFTLGTLGRFNIDKARKHALRAELAYRIYQDNYIPSYFDQFYSVEKYEMLTNIYGKDNFSADGRGKLQLLDEDSNGSWKNSVYMEVTYSLLDKLALSAGIEFFQGSASIYSHIEIPDFYIFKAMFSYYQRGITSFDTIAGGSDRTSLYRGVLRVEILPILYLNFYLGKNWVFWPESRVRDDGLQGHYLSAYEWGFNLEFGYEF